MDSSYYSPNEPISMCTVLIWKLMKYVWPSWTPSRLRRFFLLLLLNRFYPVFFSFGYKQRPPSKFKGPCESPWLWFRLWKGLFFNGRQLNRISLKKKEIDGIAALDPSGSNQEDGPRNDPWNRRSVETADEKKNERKEREREREENRSTMAKTNDVVGWSVRNRSLELRSCHHLKVTVRPSRTDNSVTQLVAK